MNLRRTPNPMSLHRNSQLVRHVTGCCIKKKKKIDFCLLLSLACSNFENADTVEVKSFRRCRTMIAPSTYYLSGTFETRLRTLRRSAYGGRPEVIGTASISDPMRLRSQKRVVP